MGASLGRLWASWGRLGASGNYRNDLGITATEPERLLFQNDTRCGRKIMKKQSVLTSPPTMERQLSEETFVAVLPTSASLWLLACIPLASCLSPVCFSFGPRLLLAWFPFVLRLLLVSFLSGSRLLHVFSLLDSRQLREFSKKI